MAGQVCSNLSRAWWGISKLRLRGRTQNMETIVDSRLVAKASDDDREFVTRRIAGETLIIPVAGQVGDLDAIYTLNDVGSRVWELIQGATPVSRIVDAINLAGNMTCPRSKR